MQKHRQTGTCQIEGLPGDGGDIDAAEPDIDHEQEKVPVVKMPHTAVDPSWR